MVLYIIKAFCFFRRRDSLSQLRVERRWFELASKGDLVITLAARFCNTEKTESHSKRKDLRLQTSQDGNPLICPLLVGSLFLLLRFCGCC